MTKMYELKQHRTKKEDIRIIRTKRDLADSLLQLLETKSFDKISVKEICKNALISKLTFYNNFKNKEELMTFVFERTTKSTFDNLKKNYLGDVNKSISYIDILISLVTLFYDEKSLFRKILKNDKEKSIYTSLYYFIKDMIPTLVAEEKSNVANEIPMEIISSYYAGALSGLFYSMAMGEFGVSIETMARYIYTLTTSKVFSMPSVIFDKKD